MGASLWKAKMKADKRAVFRDSWSASVLDAISADFEKKTQWLVHCREQSTADYLQDALVEAGFRVAILGERGTLSLRGGMEYVDALLRIKHDVKAGNLDVVIAVNCRAVLELAPARSVMVVFAYTLHDVWTPQTTLRLRFEMTPSPITVSFPSWCTVGKVTVDWRAFNISNELYCAMPANDVARIVGLSPH